MAAPAEWRPAAMVAGAEAYRAPEDGVGASACPQILPENGMFDQIALMRGSLVSILLAVLLANCSTGPQETGEIVWTRGDQDLMIGSDESRVTATLGSHPGLRQAWERLQQTSETWRAGSEDGVGSPAWGRIRDVVVDSAGHVYVLDGLDVSVRVLAPDGHLIRSFLRNGDGPMEIREPRGLALIRGDSLLVHSRSQVRVLGVARDGSPEYARNFLSQVGIQGLCDMGSGLFARVASPRIRGTVGLLSYDGAPIGAFGEMFDSKDPYLRASLSEGRIACSPMGGWVAISFNDGPRLFGYSKDGIAKWSVSFDDFEPVVVSTFDVGGRPGVTRLGAHPEDRVVGLAPLTKDLLLVQVIRTETKVKSGRRIPRTVRLRSYLVEADGRAGVYVGDHLPGVFVATDSVLYAAELSDAGVPVLMALRW